MKVSAERMVLLPLALLALGIGLELLLAKVCSARAKGWLATASGTGALLAVGAAWPAIFAGRSLDAAFGTWDGPIRLAYHVDGLSFLFAFMAAGIGAAVLLYSVDYMRDERGGATRFYALVLLFVAGLIHLVYCADLFLLYLSWEVIGICSFLLVGFWYQQPDAAYGARKVLTMTHLAGYGLLVAVVLLYARTGTTLWTDPAMQGAFTTGIFLLVLVAALAKSVQFPLHTWIPDAMAAPTPVSALLHAACYVKAGVYLVARLHSIGPWPASWGLTVAWAGAATLLVGALFMLVQRDLKRLLAFSTVSQIGYMMLGLGLGTPLGIAAALLHCLNHGLFKGGLFLCAGSIQHACGTRDMDRLGGLGRRMPRTLAIWLVCAAGVAGVPLFNGFVSKWLLYTAALATNQPLLALVPWIGSILTVFAFMKATSGVFFGSDGAATPAAHEASWPMLAGGGVLAAGCVVIGIAPQVAVAALVNPLLPALGRTPLAGVGWLGLSAGQGAWFATGGLALGLVALLFGALVYWLPAPARREYVGTGQYVGSGLSRVDAVSVFTGGEPLGPRGHLGASDFSRIVGDALGPFDTAFDADRAWLAGWRALGRLAGALSAILQQAERRPVTLLIAAATAVAAAAAFHGSTPIPAAAGHFAAGRLVAGTAIALGGLLLASAAVKALRRHTVLLGVSGLLACAGLLVEAPVARLALLEASAVVALLVLWLTTGVARARRAYLAAVVLSAAGMVGGTIAETQGHAGIAFGLLLAGAALKLGLVPCWFWLPLVAERAPAPVAGLVIGVVDVAAFGELLAWRVASPGLFDPAWPWLVLGAVTLVAGALLALAQRDIKRLLAFSTIEDMGLLTMSLALGGRYGLAGAAIGATVHALAKALLFASLAGPEADGEQLVSPRGLAARHPIAAAGFVVGAFSVLGVPPTIGYAAHWRMFAAVAADPLLLGLLAGAAMLSVATYARAIALFWWGPAPALAEHRGCDRPMIDTAIAILALVLIMAGAWPALLGGGA